MADLDCDGAQVRRDAVQGWRLRLGEGRETADDAREVVLVLWHQTLDGRDALGPESEEGDEHDRTTFEGEVVSRGGLFSAGKRDGWGRGRAA